MLCDIGCKCRWRHIFQLSDGVVGSLFQATTFTFMLVFTHTLNASKMYVYIYLATSNIIYQQVLIF